MCVELNCKSIPHHTNIHNTIMYEDAAQRFCTVKSQSNTIQRTNEKWAEQQQKYE